MATDYLITILVFGIQYLVSESWKMNIQYNPSMETILENIRVHLLFCFVTSFQIRLIGDSYTTLVAIYLFLLSITPNSGHCLIVIGWIPIRVKHNQSVCSNEIKTTPSSLTTQHEHKILSLTTNKYYMSRCMKRKTILTTDCSLDQCN